MVPASPKKSPASQRGRPRHKTGPRPAPPARKARAAEVLDRLEELYPQAETELDASNEYELLVAVILSAQCTDKRVNMVTPGLFSAFPEAEALAEAEAEEVEPWIQTCGLYRNKAKNLVKCARQLVEEHGGRVPSSRAALEALPGVGRKTANVVLSNAFGVAAIAVDTHVFRLAKRLDFSTKKTPLGVEQDLMELLPSERWTQSHHTLIWHGRRCCHARRPACEECPVADLCPSEQ